MISSLRDLPTFPPDPIGDALADCYMFLLRKLNEKSASCNSLIQLESGQHSKIADAGDGEVKPTELIRSRT